MGPNAVCHSWFQQACELAEQLELDLINLMSHFYILETATSALANPPMSSTS